MIKGFTVRHKSQRWVPQDFCSPVPFRSLWVWVYKGYSRSLGDLLLCLVQTLRKRKFYNHYINCFIICRCSCGISRYCSEDTSELLLKRKQNKTKPTGKWCKSYKTQWFCSYRYISIPLWLFLNLKVAFFPRLFKPFHCCIVVAPPEQTSEIAIH